MNFGSKKIEIQCPYCNLPLNNENETKLKCSACKKEWSIVEGVPNFIEVDNFWAEPGITREILQKINGDIKSSEWKKVMANHEVKAVRDILPFVADLDRARWCDLIDIAPNGVALDMGAGMGTISQALSSRFNSIYAVEPVKERVDFMRSRFRQEKKDNIVLIRSDIDNLPFPEKSFDLIVLNGVLEWLPCNKKNINPRKAQLFYLKKLNRLLKDNGAIYIGIENRFHYSLFRGTEDPHIPVKYVTILPRYLAHLLCWLKTGDIYRTYLYSTHGYRQLMENAGYHSTEIYSSLPSYNDPKYLIKLDRHSREFEEIMWPTEKKSIKFIKKILLNMDLLKHLGYAYAVIARK